jgi:hypothetical protein
MPLSYIFVHNTNLEILISSTPRPYPRNLYHDDHLRYTGDMCFCPQLLVDTRRHCLQAKDTTYITPSILSPRRGYENPLHTTGGGYEGTFGNSLSTRDHVAATAYCSQSRFLVGRRQPQENSRSFRHAGTARG